MEIITDYENNEQYGRYTQGFYYDRRNSWDVFYSQFADFDNTELEAHEYSCEDIPKIIKFLEKAYAHYQKKKSEGT